MINEEALYDNVTSNSIYAKVIGRMNNKAILELAYMIMIDALKVTLKSNGCDDLKLRIFH